MKAWFEGLSPRERWLVLSAAALVGFAAVQTLVIGPLWQGTASLEQQLEERERLLAELQGVRDQVSALRAGDRQAPVEAADQSLVVLVDRTSRAAGLGQQLRRNQPVGEQGLRVSFEAVAFDSLVPWLAELQQRYAIAVESASFDAGSAPGLVNATFVLERTI